MLMLITKTWYLFFPNYISLPFALNSFLSSTYLLWCESRASNTTLKKFRVFRSNARQYTLNNASKQFILINRPLTWLRCQSLVIFWLHTRLLTVAMSNNIQTHPIIKLKLLKPLTSAPVARKSLPGSLTLSWEFPSVIRRTISGASGRFPIFKAVLTAYNKAVPVLVPW